MDNSSYYLTVRSYSICVTKFSNHLWNLRQSLCVVIILSKTYSVTIVKGRTVIREWYWYKYEWQCVKQQAHSADHSVSHQTITYQHLLRPPNITFMSRRSTSPQRHGSFAHRPISHKYVGESFLCMSNESWEGNTKVRGSRWGSSCWSKLSSDWHHISSGHHLRTGYLTL